MTANLNESQEFSGRMRVLSMSRMLAFSGGPFDAAGWPAKNLHTDAGKAAEAGLTAPIASGIQCEGDIIRLLMEVFGDAWLRSGKLHVKYPRPVFAGTSLVPRARVLSRRAADAGTLVELEIWCETPEKEIVVVGNASCLET
jgi:acyl dehydratase